MVTKCVCVFVCVFLFNLIDQIKACYIIKSNFAIKTPVSHTPSSVHLVIRLHLHSRDNPEI